jgi:hypothetical protein
MAASIEPKLTTEPGLLETLQELARLESIFHRPEMGQTRADLEKLIAEDFWEVGASGKRYSKQFVLEVLEKRLADQQPDVWQTSDFYCRSLSTDVYLLAYTLIQNNVRKTLRSSIWQRSTDGWKCVYHQGTVVQGT